MSTTVVTVSPIPSPPPSVPAVPVSQAERIGALDSIRGLALLGILLMNIVAMGLYVSAYDDPTVAGGSTGINLWTWAILHVAAEGKMRCLFSMIFGASVVLLTSRLDEWRDGADIYYRRTLWLMGFGILHAYLLWLGEILYPYAMCGLALYAFRKAKPAKLLWIGGVLAVLTAGFYVGEGFSQRDMLRDGQAAIAAAQRGEKLTSDQDSAKRDYEEWFKLHRPTPEALAEDRRKWTGNFVSVVKARAAVVNKENNIAYYAPAFWDMFSMMFIGMGLLKTGVLTGQRSKAFYGWMVLIGYGIGLPVNSYTAWVIIRSHFDPVTYDFASVTYDLGRLTVALGHLGVTLLLIKSNVLRWLTHALGAVGQMALSNYVTHSVVTAFLFTGYGFKLYGRLERYQLYYVVFAIWAFQLIASPIWLRHYRFGPLEWCWRSLTYWKKQPMRREDERTAEAQPSVA